MSSYQWINHENSRYFTITIEKDGNNNIVLSHKWGGCYSNRGGEKNIFVKTYNEVHKIIDNMMKRRKRRGYELITKWDSSQTQ